MSHKADSASTGSGIDLDYLVGVLIDHKWLILATALLAAFIGLVYAVLAPPIYRADALVQIASTRNTNPLEEVTSLLGKEPPSQSEIEIIRSRSVLGRAVDILGLTLVVEPARLPVIGEFLARRGVQRPAFFANSGYVWADETIHVAALSVDNPHQGKTFDLVVKDSQDYALYLGGDYLGQGRVGEASEFMNGEINLTVDAIKAPAESEFHLMSRHRSVAITDLRNNLSIAERGRDTRILYWSLLSPEPEFAEMGLQTIADIYVSQNVQRQSEEARATLHFLNEQVPLVQTELGKAEERLNAYRAGRESVNLSLETQSVLQRLVNIEAQLNELEFSEAEISRRFMPSHPTYEALLEKKEQLRKQKSGIEHKIELLPETQQEVLRLERDISVSQQIYVQLRNKVQEMQIAEASTAGNVRILDNAAVYPRPVAPDKKLILLLATIAGLVLASTFVLLRAHWRNGVETEDELERLGLAVVGVIPRSRQQEKMRRTTGRSGKMLALCAPQDPAIEALRGVRAALARHINPLDKTGNTLGQTSNALVGSGNTPGSCIAITSPGIDEGKTFVAVNLAILFAQLGRRVLLIDSDMRFGEIHDWFGGGASPGLSEIMSEGKSLADSVQPVASVPNFFYLARGAVPADSGELLAGPRFAELLAAATAQFDLVILDTAPVSKRADAGVIGGMVTANLLVTRFRVTTSQDISLAMHRMRTMGADVSLALMNAQQNGWAVAKRTPHSMQTAEL